MLRMRLQHIFRYLRPRIVGAVARIKRTVAPAIVAVRRRFSAMALKILGYAQGLRRWAGQTFAAAHFLVRGLAAFARPSLRRVVARVHKRHFQRNPAIKAFRYSWWRLRINAVANHPLTSLGYLFLIFVVGAQIAARLVPEANAEWLVAELKHGDFQDIAIGLLVAQAALIALVFPLIIALIGVLFELRTTTGARLNIFLKETESLVVGGSALMLSAALAIQLLLFPYAPAAVSAAIIAFDVVWFVLNVLFLAFFLFNTLDFVRPERRATLFRRYIVNVAWRAELQDLITYDRLTRAVEYGYLPTTPGDLESGAKILISPMSLGSIPAAARIQINESSVLSNVFLPVLHVVAEAWLQTAHAQTQSSELTWLVFEPAPIRTYSGDVVLARSPQNLPLTSLQRILVRVAFRFQNAARRESAPDTAAFLKEHIADLLPLIDAGRIQEFESGLNQLVDLHVFFFKIAQSPSDNASDDPFSFAEISPFEFQTVGESWAQEYRDVLKRAVARLSVEPEFFSSCAFLGVRLYREVKDVARPAALTSIVRIAATLFWRLREWAESVQQAESGGTGNPGIAFRLSAARSGSYAEAWRDFVAGWERLGTEIADFPVNTADDWPATNSRFLPVWDHLKTTTTMVAGGAKGGDLLAVNWSTDMLIKWYEHMRRRWGDEPHALFSGKLLLTPDVLLEPWDDVTATTQLLLGDTLQPRSVFTAAVENAWRDVQLVLMCVLIRWSVQTTVTGAAAIAARKLLRSETHDHDSEAGHQRVVFGSAASALEAIIRIANAERRFDAGHSAAISALAERLDDLTTEPYVSGRIYSSNAVHGFQELGTEQALILAVLAQRSPVGDGLPAGIETALQTILSNDDVHARRLLARLEQIRNALRELNPAVYAPIFLALAG